MDSEGKKSNNKKFIILGILIVVIIIGSIIVINGFKKTKNGIVFKEEINLEDNSIISPQLDESDYEVPILDMDEKSFSTSIDFYDYKSEYISVNIGEEYKTPYKNTIKSIILENVEKVDVNELEKVSNDYKETVLKHLKYDDKKPITEFDRHKDLSKELDENKTVYENLKSGESFHHMVLFEERLGYDIVMYVENNTLIGEISYYIQESE